ncbi:response regulator [Nitrincola sp.]|uniref:response regulator n=1 Tax=Nitrincola sp. TaxID=1926584 RepID=UPI003A8F6705
MNKNSVVFIAGSNKSIVEVVYAQLRDEFEKLIMQVSNTIPDLQREFSLSYADILILAFEDLNVAAQLSEAVFSATRKSPLKPYRVLALCNKSNVKRAYTLYGERLINDYIVYWPLTYDPYRLVLSVRQAVDDLKYNDDAKQLLREVAALKKQLDEQNNWIERARSTPGFEEPAMTPSLSADEEDAQWSKLIDDKPVVSQTPKGPQKQVLIVDDDQFQRSVLRKLLMAEHFEIRFAENGLDGLEMMRRRQFDLILLDLMMPGMSGLDVMKYLRRHPGTVSAPVVIISGEHEKEVVVECLKLGASGYVVKPYTRKTLLEKIDKALIVDS